LQSEGIVGEYVATAYVAEDGTYEFVNVPAGLRLLSFKGDGLGFVWAPEPFRALRVRPGVKAVMDLRLRRRAKLRVDGGRSSLKPIPGLRVGARNELERWVLGFESGTSGATGPSRLLFPDAAPVALLQSADGEWQPMGMLSPPPDSTFVFPAGIYDFWLIELSNPVERPAARLLRTWERFHLGEDGPTTLRLEGPLLPAGSAELAGSFRASRAAGLEELLACGSLTEFHNRLAPRVDLYDATGRYVGTAFATIQEAELKELGQALDRMDERAVERLLRGRRREFRIGGLAAGRYRARIWAHGYGEREMWLDLEEWKPTRLDIDLDALFQQGRKV